MIFAPADTNLYIPISNLPATHKHYKTYTNLCSAVKSTLETYYNRMIKTVIDCNRPPVSGINCRGTTTSRVIGFMHIMLYLRNP